MSKTGTVYAIRHNPTGKIYVGSTRNLESRIAAHMSGLRNGHHPCESMQKDFDAYGDDYSLSILYSGSLEGKDKTQMEHAFMTILNTRDPDVGYNGKGPAKAFDKGSVSWVPVPKENVSKAVQRRRDGDRMTNRNRTQHRCGETMEAYVFPESMTPERISVAKRLADFCQSAKWADVARLDTIIQTTANIRAADEDGENQPKGA